MKRFPLAALLAIFLVLTHLPEASATTYVRLKITFSEKAGNLPTSTRAEARGINDSFFYKAEMKDGAFNLDVPQGINLNLRVTLTFSEPEKFGTRVLQGQSRRTIVPYIDLNTRNPLRFDADTEINIQFDAPKILTLNVTDSQLKLVQNAEINSEVLTNKILIQGSEWNLKQHQLIPGNGSQIYSKDGTFQFAFYAISDTKVKFGYFDVGNLSLFEYAPTPNTSGLSGVTQEFKVNDFESVNLCLPFNFDSTRTTNKDCLENVLKTKAAAELKAKQEADAKAAADLKAKQEADAKAAATKKTTITCVKGKLTKKVTSVKPKCPSGYKRN